MKILITAPRLNEDENVSGIASLVRGIIARGKNEYVHFVAGRKDGEGSGIRWLFRQTFLPFLYRRTIKRASPVVVHLNTSFEPRAIIRDSVLAAATPKDIRLLLHVHGGRFVLNEYPSAVIAARANQMLRSAQKIIVLSDAEKHSILRRVPDLSIEVMPNAVSTADIPFVQRTNSRRTILYFGRIDMPKGLQEIVAACRTLVEQGIEFRFTCCGTGPAEGYFVNEMKSVLSDRFEHRGVVKGVEKWSVLSSADIFLLPSKFEGLPIALLEAMAAGCIPVVSNVGAMAEAVADDVSGYIVEPGNVDQIVDKLKMLLSKDQTELSEMRRLARATTEERYDMAGYVENLENLYASMLDKK
ncbi:MAG TPA: glycosyltransferase family 4 protein [Pyrinomonadaceae bacterium]|jgi:glycosyltransferase involved in cell wall biosynthesis|nr:glycosyltransferase family 4 protein [Pyrinomonadaceae bacterium]